MTTIRIAIPDSLHATVRDIVEREGMSFKQFIALAMAEKASAIATKAYLEARAQRGHKEKFLSVFSELCRIVEETIELYEREGRPLPLPPVDKSTQKRDVNRERRDVSQ